MSKVVNMNEAREPKKDPVDDQQSQSSYDVQEAMKLAQARKLKQEQQRKKDNDLVKRSYQLKG